MPPISFVIFCDIFQGMSSHCGTMRTFIAAFPSGNCAAGANGFTLEAFPPYSPELNPAEHVWSFLKNDTANGRPDTLFELTDHVIGKMAEMSLSQRHLRRCVHETQLSLF